MRTAIEWADELEGKLADIRAAFDSGNYETIPGLAEELERLVEEFSKLEGTDRRAPDLLADVYDLGQEAQRWPQRYHLRQQIEELDLNW